MAGGLPTKIVNVLLTHCAKDNAMYDSTINLFHPVHLPEMEAAAIEVMRSRQIATGPKVFELEKSFKKITGRDYLLSTNDLTSAITLALHLAGVRAGDEVATIAFSCLQSNSPIARLGAKPRWIDINPETMSMSLDDLDFKLSSTVKAVMVYHVAGYPADIDRIAEICNARRIPLIEDCNNAIGARYNNQPVGFKGNYSVYSLYPNRQINGIDGGMLATPDSSSEALAIRLRRFGIDSAAFRDLRGEINPNTDVCQIGWSASLSHLNAAVALSQLNTLQNRILRTQKIAERLKDGLIGFTRLHPVIPVAGTIPSYWGLLVRSSNRDGLLDHMKANGIKTSILHQRNDWYSGFGTPRQDLPGTAAAMNEILAIPCGWWLTDIEINSLLTKLGEFDAA